MPGADGYRTEDDHSGSPLEQTLAIIEKDLIPRNINSGHEAESLNQAAHDWNEGNEGNDVGEEVGSRRAPVD